MNSTLDVTGLPAADDVDNPDEQATLALTLGGGDAIVQRAVGQLPAVVRRVSVQARAQSHRRSRSWKARTKSGSAPVNKRCSTSVRHADTGPSFGRSKTAHRVRSSPCLELKLTPLTSVFSYSHVATLWVSWRGRASFKAAASKSVRPRERACPMKFG